MAPTKPTLMRAALLFIIVVLGTGGPRVKHSNLIIFICEFKESRSARAYLKHSATLVRRRVTKVHDCHCWQSFWKRGSLRSGSNIGSSLRSAGVSGPAGE